MPTFPARQYELSPSGKEVAQLLDIDVLDHVIIGDEGRYSSLRDRGVTFDRRPAITS